MAVGAKKTLFLHARNLVLSILWGGVTKRLRVEQPKVFAVVGSVGKTSTKEAIASVLAKGSTPVEKSFGNMATDTGLALSLTGTFTPPRGVIGWKKALLKAATVRGVHTSPYWVLEYSSDKKGDTAFLVEKLPPQVTVVCTIVPVHMEQYETAETMLQETLSIIPMLSDDAIVIANADDPLQRDHIPELAENRRVVWYGIRDSYKEPGVWAHDIKHTDLGLTTKISLINASSDGRPQAVRQISVQLAILAQYQLYPLLAAAASAMLEGLSLSEIKAGLQAYQLPAGRGRLIEGRDGVVIIDDSANASPEAMIMGLRALQTFNTRRRVAVIGNMNELGAISKAEHVRVGEVAGTSCDFLLAVGPNAQNYQRGAEKVGMKSEAIKCYETAQHLLDDVLQQVRANDVVFVKASQNGMYLERVVEMLMLEPDRAPELLFRQEKYWKAKRV